MVQILADRREKDCRRVGRAMKAEGSDVAGGFGSVGPPPGLDIKERLRRLEARMPLLDQRLDAIERQLSDERASRTRQVSDEARARETGDAQMGDRLELTATGGLRLSAIGLSWLVFGTILAGFAPEIAAVSEVTSRVPVVGQSFRPNWPAIARSTFFAFAVLFSIFYALKAIDIFTGSKSADMSGPQKIHQYWLNFVGSAVGWCCLWFVGLKVVGHISSGTDPEIGWPYACVALVAFVGITGYLPFTVVKLVNSVGGLVEKIPGISKPKE